MIKAITPQLTSQPRTGLNHASHAIARLMKIYGLESEMEQLAQERAREHELAAAEQISAEFTPEFSPVATAISNAAVTPLAPALPVLCGSQQNTFSWFE